MTIPRLPCVWGRVTCFGQVDADGLTYNGCGSYDVAAPDRIILAEKTRTCLLCGSKNVELNPQFCTGSTSQPLLKPTTPIQTDPQGVKQIALNGGSPGTIKKRKAYFDRMDRIMGDERKKKRVKSTNHYVSRNR